MAMMIDNTLSYATLTKDSLINTTTMMAVWTTIPRKDSGAGISRLESEASCLITFGIPSNQNLEELISRARNRLIVITTNETRCFLNIIISRSFDWKNYIYLYLSGNQARQSMHCKGMFMFHEWIIN